MSVSLFEGIDGEGLQRLLACLSSRKKTYEKDECVFNTSFDEVKTGIVVSGSINIVKEDYWGNNDIMVNVRAGDIFGEAFAFSSEKKLPIIVLAAEKTEIMFLDFSKIYAPCTTVCGCHTTLIHNLISILADKNIRLTNKIEHLTKRTTREKLMSYLSEQSEKQQSNEFTIPFNRQQLADYISVDRSAMSAELCKMRDDGILQFNKNNFKLL